MTEPVRAGRRKFFDLARPSRQHLLGYILIAPAVLMVAAIIVWPLVLAIDLSFQQVKIPRLGGASRPFSLSNYTWLFSSPEFWLACWVTLKLVVVVTAGSVAVGLSTALLANNRFKGRTVARLGMALPWAVPEIIAVVIFAWMFDTSFGLFGWLAIKLGFTDQMIPWVSSSTAAFWAVAITMVWKGFPFVSIMCLAGLQSIPADYYAAAKVDGASVWQRFRWITMPLLMPVLGVTLVLTLLWVFRDFSIIKVLTGGGPLRSTQTLSIMTYDQAFQYHNFGRAAAVGVLTLVICIVASLLMLGRRSKSIY
ncbi:MULTISPECIES: carbohydrate ABC transporter permease [Rhizobium/Agrobacterium group]|jgi:multiple sugar transport system permease protein|uniref:ABC transporter, membrane spanning protein n=1 Tax=Agrobacterium deltaense Zutra 3/1 TaxID=1183427 RepID=A0A1S7RA88_9HYPH|nr:MULTISPECIES: sugar ABC transporter permease [Rhizobium/Agrobacterium group]MBB4403529.1 multiple sugar transport system permease protein [Agrobacterium radiobacter]MBB5589681.1 multiple sugar transport system permease protein [Agrobacterium radiobacter]MDA5635558.1 sugar ABC transporter permease [Agrobacterium sp. ST15.16.024]MDF1890620.1 sugar ABC transporter permease [Rhizobium rhizogenes]NSX92085.1 sugar ABC transporter permease [Agrobacterium tumefaciens]